MADLDSKNRTAEPNVAGLARWARRKYWTEREAAFLFCSIVPDEVEPVDGHYPEAVDSDTGRYIEEFRFVRWGETYPGNVLEWLRLIAVAKTSGELRAGKLSPRDWIHWATKLGVGPKVPILLRNVVNAVLALKKEQAELSTKERTSVAIVIGALFKMAKLDLAAPSKAAESILTEAASLKLKIGKRTVENLINQVAATLHEQ